MADRTGIGAAYLLDTDWLISLLNGRPQARALFSSLAPEGIALSAVSLGEAYEGALFSHDPERAERTLLRTVADLELVGLDTQTMKIFGQVRGHLRRAGLLIPTADLQIAATALRHDLTLVTRNRRHFDRVPGLDVVP